MRVCSTELCTRAAWWVGTWLITTAIWPHVLPSFMFSANTFNAALMQLVPPYQRSCSSIMAPLQFLNAPPLRVYCFLVAAEPCSRTKPGNRCAQDCGVDSQPGFHVLQSPSCNFKCCSSSVILSTPLCAEARPLSVSPCLHSFATCSAPPALFIMPKLRQRMGCKRGSSRGRVIRQPSSSTSDSSSYSSGFCSDRYPVTRSGRGRSRGQHNSASKSHNSHSHTARFQFPCTLSNYSFIASVTIELREGSAGLVAATLGVTMETRAEDSPGTSQFYNKQNKDPGGTATQDMQTEVGPSVPTSGGSSGKEGYPSEDDDPYNYGCRIVEESPSTTHEA